MGTIFFFIGLGAGLLVILAHIPGIKHIVKPVIESFWDFLMFLVSESHAWIVFVVKIIWRSHVVLIKNLTQPKEKIDPTSKIEDA